MGVRLDADTPIIPTTPNLTSRLRMPIFNPIFIDFIFPLLLSLIPPLLVLIPQILVNPSILAILQHLPTSHSYPVLSDDTRMITRFYHSSRLKKLLFHEISASIVHIVVSQPF